MEAVTAPSIRAIGLAVPEPTLSQDELAELMIGFHQLDAAGARRLRTLYRRSRIGTRHACIGDIDRPAPPFHFDRRNLAAARSPSTSERMAVYRREAPLLVQRACADALAQPGAPPVSAIDHVFVASCTGFLAPGLDVLLARALGLRPDVGRSLVGFQGCQAGLSVLRLADHLCRADPSATALVACVELCTLHFQARPTDDNLLGNSLFADGAAAVLVSGRGVERCAPSLAIRRTETLLHPDSLDDMTWTVGDEGFELHLSSLIPRLLGLDVRPFVTGALGLDPASLGRHFWAVHPGGSAILDAVESALELPPRALASSREVLHRYGNMSSPTIFFILRRFLDDAELQGSGVALTFGPGLTVEAALLTRDDARPA